jgi:hypothetical protein
VRPDLADVAVQARRRDGARPREQFARLDRQPAVLQGVVTDRREIRSGEQPPELAFGKDLRCEDLQDVDRTLAVPAQVFEKQRLVLVESVRQGDREDRAQIGVFMLVVRLRDDRKTTRLRAFRERVGCKARDERLALAVLRDEGGERLPAAFTVARQDLHPDPGGHTSRVVADRADDRLRAQIFRPGHRAEREDHHPDPHPAEYRRANAKGLRAEALGPWAPRSAPWNAHKLVRARKLQL